MPVYEIKTISRGIFEFTTENGTNYEVHLTPDENLLESPLCPVYILNIFKMNPEFKSKGSSRYVKETVYLIFAPYLNQNCCILWQCDVKDKRQIIRHTLFEKWYQEFKKPYHMKLDEHFPNSNVYISLVLWNNNEKYDEIVSELKNVASTLRFYN